MPSEAVRVEWSRRVAAEYAVCTLAQQFSLRLTAFGAPSDLIQGALGMALDELEHARLASEVCTALGAEEPVAFDPGAFTVGWSSDPATSIAAVAVPNLCLGETLALRIVHQLRRNATEGPARAALDRVVLDEPRHAALGWETLDWLLGGPSGDVVREAVERELLGWLEMWRNSFAGPEVEPHLIDLESDDLIWGLASPDTQRAIFEQTFERDWVPRLARRGFQITELPSVSPSVSGIAQADLLGRRLRA